MVIVSRMMTPSWSSGSGTVEAVHFGATAQMMDTMCRMMCSGMTYLVRLVFVRRAMMRRVMCAMVRRPVMMRRMVRAMRMMFCMVRFVCVMCMTYPMRMMDMM